MISFLALISNVSASDFPLPLATQKVMPLRNLADQNFQKGLENALSQNKTWRKLIREKRMAVGLVDLSDLNHVLFARVNGGEMMYAASLPKIAILLAAFHSFEYDGLEQTPKIMGDLTLMIRKSNNQAATRVIEKITLKRIQQILIMPQYEFYDQDHGGGLWVGKKYAKTDSRLPDPIKGLSHGATATQVCRFYYQLAMGRLINLDRSRQMLEILVDPGIEHKFVKVLKNIVPDAKIFRKSGTWKTWHSDSVLVWGPEWRRYIAVALVEDKNGEMILRKLLPVLESVLKDNTGKATVPRLEQGAADPSVQKAGF
ncbi:serine hydrolase [uncultured Desulfobacter sp.]|uniref:serine hydrolase n=1 Tax=uncultured Desulfobacter sp. TaxID=240139 RepID=UPI002AAA72C7|nr:serine hydrolase [uncultured Desulfobacter sp.]